MIRTAIITVSDSGYARKRKDESGPAIRKILEATDFAVTEEILLPDEREQLSSCMKRIADTGAADLILTTGGTGFSPRDITPEATIDICERLVPGIPESMRYCSLQITNRAMLSRSAAGIRKQTLIVNLPGSPKAVRECLEFILEPLAHGIDILTDKAHNCAAADVS